MSRRTDLRAPLSIFDSAEDDSIYHLSLPGLTDYHVWLDSEESS